MKSQSEPQLKWHGWVAAAALLLAHAYCAASGGLVATMPPEGQPVIYWPYQAASQGLAPGAIVVLTVWIVLVYSLARVANHLRSCLGAAVSVAGLFLTPPIFFILVLSLGLAGGYSHITSVQVGAAVYNVGIEYDGEGFSKGFLCRCGQAGITCHCHIVPGIVSSSADALRLVPLPADGLAVYRTEGDLLYTWPGDQP